MTVTRTLPEIIRRRRRELDLTQVQVAEALGFKSADYICLVEQGLRNLDLDKIPMLAEVLKLDPVYLSKTALETQYPVMAKCLLKDSTEIKSKGRAYSDVDIAVDRLRSLARNEQSLVVNLINTLFDQRNGRRSRTVAA